MKSTSTSSITEQTHSDPGSLTFNSLKITDVSKLLVLTYRISSNFEEEFLQVTGLFGCSFFNTDI